MSYGKALVAIMILDKSHHMLCILLIVFYSILHTRNDYGRHTSFSGAAERTILEI